MLLRNEAGLTPQIIAAGPPFGIAYTRTELDNRTAQQGEEKYWVYKDTTYEIEGNTPMRLSPRPNNSHVE